MLTPVWGSNYPSALPNKREKAGLKERKREKKILKKHKKEK